MTTEQTQDTPKRGPDDSVEQIVGIELTIKPKRELPDNPSHRDFGGEAKRLVVFTDGDYAHDEMAIMEMACAALRTVHPNAQGQP